jgi:hypothetical protein
MNSDHWLGRQIISLHRDPFGEHGWGFLTGTMKEDGCRRRGPVGKPGEGVHL